MIKNTIKNILKYNRTIYVAYYHVAGFFLRLLGLFVRTDDHLILFNSFAGRNYDDSPKAIYLKMKDDQRFVDYEIVWAFNDPQGVDIGNVKKVKTDTLQYFITALKSKVWVTNSSVERGLSFKKNRTVYFNTWHGTPIKKMGSDIAAGNKSFKAKKGSSVDMMMSQGDYETQIFSRCFHIPKERFLEAGLPRNDVLANYTEEEKNAIKERIGLDFSKKVILYCPTFREYEKDNLLGVVMAPPIDLVKWEEALGDNFIFLIRAHYEVSKVLNIKEDDFVKNMTGYPSLNDLMIVSDILISDYSSIFFDYSITGKPMLHFTYDYDEYSSKRGMYFDIRDYLDGADNEDALIKLIKGLDASRFADKTVHFRDKFVNYYGHAAERAIDYIAERLDTE